MLNNKYTTVLEKIKDEDIATVYDIKTYQKRALDLIATSVPAALGRTFKRVKFQCSSLIVLCFSEKSNAKMKKRLHGMDE